MRSRNIKPGFFKNDMLGELSPLARILFAGLWCLADREGRLEDRPKRIKADVLPYDECSTENLLDDLVAAGLIIRYEANGNRFIQVITFLEHQNPHRGEAPSIIPSPYGATPAKAQEKSDSDTVLAPEQHSTSTVLILCKPETRPEQAQDEHETNLVSEQDMYHEKTEQVPGKQDTSTVQTPDLHSTNPADSFPLIPDSFPLIPDSLPLIPDSLNASVFTDESETLPDDDQPEDVLLEDDLPGDDLPGDDLPGDDLPEDNSQKPPGRGVGGGVVIPLELDVPDSAWGTAGSVRQVTTFYNQHRRNMAESRGMSASRQKFITARLKQYGMEQVKQVIITAKESDFLNGLEGERRFTADLGWLMKPDNFLKVLEGKYTKRRQMQNGTANIPGGAGCGYDTSTVLYKGPGSDGSEVLNY